MGFNKTSGQITLTANFTVFGRQQLLGNNSNVITHFSLGDGDAYYGVSLPLKSGEVPTTNGILGLNNSTINSIAKGYTPKSLIYSDAKGSKKKLVKEGSNNITNTIELLGQKTITASLVDSPISQNIIDRTNFETDSLVNLFYSFKLPITDVDDKLFISTPSSKGGYSDTALNVMSQDKVLILGIDNNEYGEMVDGKTIKVEVTNTLGSKFTLYSTYERTLTPNKQHDANFSDKSFNSSVFGNNIAFLFSDDIQKPNNDSTKTWSKGHFATKPYSKSGKELFNMFNEVTTSTVSDKIVGIAFLDKGFIVIVDQTIINDFDPTHANALLTKISFDSISTQINQNITCIIDRGEFGTSSNPTWGVRDKIRVSEVLLLDEAENIIAVAKLDRHIELTSAQFMALNIKISV